MKIEWYMSKQIKRFSCFVIFVLLFTTYSLRYCLCLETNKTTPAKWINDEDYRNEILTVSPYFSLSLMDNDKWGIMNEGITVDAVINGQRGLSIGLNIGALHTHKQTTKETSGKCRRSATGRGACPTQEVDKSYSSFGNYYRISGRFGWLFVFRKSMFNRVGGFLNCDLGAIIPMHTYIKNTQDARENNRQDTKLQPSFIGEINFGAVVSLFHFSFGYRYVNIIETPQKTARNVSQLIFNIGLNF